MKTVYVMWNYDGDEVMFASEDKELVQEMMYDFFIDDALEAFGWEYHERDYKFPAPISQFILILIGILVIPISHFKVAAGEKNMRQIEYKTYVVQYGDTLWGLADSYMGKNFKNHQDYIHDVMRANGMNQLSVT